MALRSTLFILAGALSGGIAAAAVPLSGGSAGPDQYLCGQASTTLGADPLQQGESGQWALISGAGELQSPNSNVCVVTGLGVGENVFRWYVIGGGSPGSDDVSINVFDPNAPAANAGPDLVACTDQPSIGLQAVSVPFPMLADWAVISGSAQVQSATQANSTVLLPQQGPSSLVWTVYNGTCGTTQDTMLVTLEDCMTAVPERAQAAPPKLFPQPADGWVTVEATAPIREVIALDAQGRELARWQGSGLATVRSDVSALPAGLIVLRIAFEEGFREVRCLIAR